jgi:hypothetical protein
LEEPGLDPFLEAIMGGRAGAELGGIEGLPLAAGAQDIQDGLQANPVVLAGAATAEAVAVLVRGQQVADSLPQVIG